MSNTEHPFEVVFRACRKFVTEFTKSIGGFEDRGILNSEMLAICALSEELGVEVFIESGRWKAQSTEVLAKYFANKPVLIESIEAFWDENALYVEKKIGNIKNLNLLYGDAHELIPKLAKKHRGKKIAFLFDGPKGQAALDAFRLALTKNDTVIAGFFHDMRKPIEGMLTESRGEMEKIFPNAFYTDDEQFVKEFGHLDESCLTSGWKPYAIDDKKIGSYGPTIGLLLPTREDYKDAHRDKWLLTYVALKRRLVLYAVRVYHFLKRLFKV